jgi:hypothetical protein
MFTPFVKFIGVAIVVASVVTSINLCIFLIRHL